MKRDRERFLTLGFDELLTKPIDTQTFGAVVETFLARKFARATE